MHGDVEKNDAKELHSVSVQEERINNVRDLFLKFFQLQLQTVTGGTIN